MNAIAEHRVADNTTLRASLSLFCGATALALVAMRVLSEMSELWEFVLYRGIDLPELQETLSHVVIGQSAAAALAAMILAVLCARSTDRLRWRLALCGFLLGLATIGAIVWCLFIWERPVISPFIYVQF